MWRNSFNWGLVLNEGVFGLLFSQFCTTLVCLVLSQAPTMLRRIADGNTHGAVPFYQGMCIARHQLLFWSPRRKHRRTIFPCSLNLRSKISRIFISLLKLHVFLACKGLKSRSTRSHWGAASSSFLALQVWLPSSKFRWISTLSTRKCQGLFLPKLGTFASRAVDLMPLELLLWILEAFADNCSVNHSTILHFFGIQILLLIVDLIVSSIQRLLNLKKWFITLT